MVPLMFELTRTDRNVLNNPNRTDLAAIESIASMRGFGVYRVQICVNGQARLRMGSETLKLRVV